MNEVHNELGRFANFIILLFVATFLSNRFAFFWLKGYQRGSLKKSQQNGEKQTMRKNCLPTGIEPAAFGLPVRLLWEDIFSHCLCQVVAVLLALPEASALVAFRPEAR